MKRTGSSPRWPIAACLLVAVAFACEDTGAGIGPPDGLLPLGTWGGDSGGVIANDTATHVHVGCTYGDVPGRLAVDAAGSFDVAGRYLLRAYPIAVGPTLPARFTGRVVGSTLTITVTVTDTVQRQTVVRGPVVVKLGEPPRLGPCPICRR